MSKMSDRRRKAKKKQNKKRKALKSLNNIKSRIPVPPPGYSFKSKKDYNRQDNKKIVDRELKGE